MHTLDMHIGTNEPSVMRLTIRISLLRVLFPGGGASLVDSGYSDVGRFMYKMAMEVLGHSCSSSQWSLLHKYLRSQASPKIDLGMRLTEE